MKSKIFVSILFLVLMLNVLSFNVSSTLGSQEDYVEDFEDDYLTDGSPDDYYYGEKWLQVTNTTEYSYVHTEAQTGNKGYLFTTLSSEVLSKAYFNFTYSSTQIINNLSFWLKVNLVVSGRDIEICCYDENDVKFLYFWQEISKFYWESYSGAEELRTIPSDTWLDISFEILNNETIKIFDGDSSHTFPPLLVIDNPRISYITIEYKIHFAKEMYLDNLEIVLGTGEEEEEEEGTVPPCDPYSTIGNVGIGTSSVGTNYRYLWTVYGVESRMIVTRLDLEVKSDMANVYSTGDIRCKMGIHNLGTASSIVELSPGGSYRISWTGLNIYINNTLCPIMFKFREDYPIYGIWRSNIYVSTSDLNKDGLNFCVYSNADEYYTNFHNKIDECPIGFGQYLSQNYEPVVRLCVDILGTSELKEYIGNEIWCSPTEIKNNSFTKIGFSLNLSNMGESNKFIVIQKPDSTTENIWGVTTQTGHTTYTAHQEGLHYANLSIDGVNASSTSFTVTGNLNDWIETKPNPSDPNGDFDIIYNYSKSSTGAVRIFDSKENLIQTFYVNPESSGTETTSLPIGKYIIKLQEIIIVGDKNQYVTLIPYPHSVQGQVVDYIEVEQEVASLEHGFRAYGQHNHVGENIVVRVGGSEEIDVSDNTDFSVWCYPTTSGYYRVSLILKKSDGTELELDWDYVTVKSGLFDEDVKTDLENLMDIIPDFYKIIAGIVITIVITISPILLTSQIAQFSKVPVDFKVPAIAYPILAIGATLLCVTLGLYGIEITFFFLAICVIAGFLVYYSGNNGGNG